MQGALWRNEDPRCCYRDRIKSHLAKYYRKMDRTPPWE